MSYNSDYFIERKTGKITYSYTKPSYFFILEWVNYISYFTKFCKFLDYFIMKSLVINYYSESNYLDSRQLITRIVKNLNFYIFGFIHHEYFCTFEFTINRFKFLKDYITSNENFPIERKKIFINFIVESVETLNDIIRIFQENNNFPYYDNNFKVFFSSLNYLNLEYIPITGGIDYNKNKIKSFWCSTTLITNGQFLNFIKNKGYCNYKYWSKDGLSWLKSAKIYSPKHWINLNNHWFIKNFDIETSGIANFPVTNLSYFEAEACANFYKARLPSEEEWNWISSNRNKTVYPYGLELPIIKGIVSDFNELDVVDLKNHESLMGFYHLYGNVWEFTTSIEKDTDNNINICLKGGDWLTPSFIINNDLKMHIFRESQDFFTGFRLIKDK